VAEFLRSEDLAVAESALFALGNSRQPEAFDMLQAFWKESPAAELHETTLIAMSLLRLAAANDFLLSLLAEAPEPTAALALSALAIHSYDKRVQERVAAVVDDRASPVLSKLFKER
jgi:hypothetical protein